MLYGISFFNVYHYKSLILRKHFFFSFFKLALQNNDIMIHGGLTPCFLVEIPVKVVIVTQSASTTQCFKIQIVQIGPFQHFQISNPR